MGHFVYGWVHFSVQLYRVVETKYLRRIINYNLNATGWIVNKQLEQRIVPPPSYP